MLLPSSFILFLIFTTGSAFHVLTSPAVTNWGHFRGWSNCPAGMYAVGIQIKAEGDQGGNDDTGLNSVMLYCRYLVWKDINPQWKIMSGEGPFGDWGNMKWCPFGQFIIGYQLRSEPAQGNGDDVAASNFKAYCGSPFNAGSRNVDNMIMGDTVPWGDWTAIQWCPEGMAVSGINAQIEGVLGDGDDTSLNNVNLLCREVDLNCKPDVKHSLLKIYDNRRGPGVMTYEYMVSSSFTRSTTNSDTLTNHEKRIVANKIAQELGVAKGPLSHKLQVEFSESMETGSMRSLQTMVQNTVTHTKQEKFTIQIPAGKRVRIEQMVFTCGEYELGVAKTTNTAY